jgi:hypothetical protein
MNDIFSRIIVSVYVEEFDRVAQRMGIHFVLVNKALRQK